MATSIKNLEDLYKFFGGNNTEASEETMQKFIGDCVDDRVSGATIYFSDADSEEGYGIILSGMVEVDGISRYAEFYVLNYPFSALELHETLRGIEFELEILRTEIKDYLDEMNEADEDEDYEE